jgi:hypothetical protein
MCHSVRRQIFDIDVDGMKYDGVTLVDQISIGGRFTVRDGTFGLVDERISTHAKLVIFDTEKWRPKQDTFHVANNNLKPLKLISAVQIVIVENTFDGQVIAVFTSQV